MRPFLHALTFSFGLSLLVPTAAHGRGALGGYDAPPPQPTRAEIQAEKDAEQASVYFLGVVAAIVGMLVVVQFVREVRGSAPPPRVIVYSARSDSYDGIGSYDGSGTHHGLDAGDDGDDYDDRPDGTDF